MNIADKTQNIAGYDFGSNKTAKSRIALQATLWAQPYIREGDF